MNCKFLCEKKLHSLKRNTLPTFRHIDYSTIGYNLDFKVCNYCGTIFNFKQFERERKYFKTNQFLKSKHTYNLSRQKDQTKILSKFLKKKNLRILDYGCFDGKLLIELNKKIKYSYFYGLEISNIFKKIFPKKKNFFFIRDIKKIKHKMDLIIFSNTIYYLKNPVEILKISNNLLKPNGLIYIENTDLKKNPLYILNGDQFFYAFDHTMKHLLNLTNYKIIKKNFDNLKNSNVYICKKSKNKIIKPKYKDYLLKYKLILNKFDKTFKKLKNISFSKYVFGTTINAAFADEALKNNDIIFVDEDYRKTKEPFRSNLVVNPKKIQKKETIILNYGKLNMHYAKILKKYQFSLKKI
tara:strand:- start:591 stop:1649 length:1059 start_codon:yes stop_codon:yes gene_type:complete